MTMNGARFVLLSVFIGFLIVQMVALSIVNQKMWPDEFQAAILKVLAVYSVHLTVILGAIFGQTGTQVKDAPAELAWAAILLALLWNLLLGWRAVSFSLASQDSVQNLVKFYDGVSSTSSFLVAGALTFFFTKGAATARRIAATRAKSAEPDQG